MEGAREDGRGVGGMSRRAASWLAWSMCALSVVTVLTFSTMGAVVASRRPDNLIGWLFCAIGFVGGVRLLSIEYAAYSLVAQSDLPPGAEALACIASWLWVPDIGLFLYLALLFPNGRLPSTHGRSPRSSPLCCPIRSCELSRGACRRSHGPEGNW